MDDNLKNLMSGFENQSFNLDISILVTELLVGSIQNNELLKEVLGQQLELKELLNGTPNDLKEIVDEKYSAIMDNLSKAVEQRFYEVIQQATKS